MMWPGPSIWKMGHIAGTIHDIMSYEVQEFSLSCN